MNNIDEEEIQLQRNLDGEIEDLPEKDSEIKRDESARLPPIH